MRKMMTCSLSLCMAAAMLFAPCSVLAADESVQEEKTDYLENAKTYYIEDTIVNPLYEGIIDPADLKPLKPYSSNVQAQEDETKVYYTSIEDAGDEVRGYLLNRQETFTISYVAEEYSKALVQSIMDAAQKHGDSGKEGDYLQWQHGGVHIRTSVLSQGGLSYMSTEFTVTYYTTAAQEKELDAKLAQVYSDLNLDSLDPMAKASTMYHYITSNVSYDYEHSEDDNDYIQYTAYAALMNGKAVCQGYAALLYRMFMDNEIDCRVIAGLGGDEAHGWNIFRIDGLYYNADSTWDAGKEEYRYFMKIPSEFPNHTRYDEYNTQAFHDAFPMAGTAYVYDQNNPPAVEPASPLAAPAQVLKLDPSNRLYIDQTRTVNAQTVADFAWPEKVTAVTLMEGVTSLDGNALTVFPSLSQLSLPASLPIQDAQPFINLEKLQKVEIAKDNTTAKSDNGVILNKNGTKVIFVPRALEFIDFEVGQGIEIIGTRAFFGSRVQKRITFAKSVNTIESQAFAGAGSTMESLTFSDTAPSIAADAFDGTSLTVLYKDYKTGWSDLISRDWPAGIQFEALASPFTDVSDPVMWFYNYVLEANEQGIMTGLDPENGIFGPHETVSRGMAVTVLYRLAGSPSTEYESVFKDVANPSIYYAVPVTWAVQNHIVTGYTGDKEGYFGPDDAVTREQLATMLYRFANWLGADTSARASLDTFVDGDQVSDFAKDALSWLIATGQMSGKDEGTRLDARGSSERCELAKLCLGMKNLYL